MQHLTPYVTRDGEKYNLPPDKIDAFRADFGESAQPARRFQTKDGQSYTVPESRAADFLADFPDAQATRRLSFADGSTRDFTVPELSKFLRSKEFREGARYAADRAENDQRSAAWAGVKGFGGEMWGQAGANPAAIRDTAAETKNPFYKGYAYLQDLSNALVGGLIGGTQKITEGVGHALGDNAVGRAVVDYAREQQAAVRNTFVTDMTDTKGGGALNKVLETGKSVAGMTGEFAPAAIPGVGAAYGASVVAAGSVNRAAQVYDAAVANGFSPLEANALALAGGGVDAAQNMMLMGAFKGIWKGGQKAAADAAKKGLVRRLLSDTARTGGVMGAGAALGDVIDQNAGIGEDGQVEQPGKYSIARTAKKGWDGFIEGGLFHLVNTGAHAMPRAVEWAGGVKERAAERQMAAEAARAALDTPEGRALVFSNSPEAAKKVFEARRQGKAVSRRMLKELGIPDGAAPTAADRNALGDALMKDHDAWKDWQRRQPDEVQSAALDEAIASVGGEGKRADAIRNDVLRNVTDAKELDDPQRRAQLVDDAVKRLPPEEAKPEAPKPAEGAETPPEATPKTAKDIIEAGRRSLAASPNAKVPSKGKGGGAIVYTPPEKDAKPFKIVNDSFKHGFRGGNRADNELVGQHLGETLDASLPLPERSPDARFRMAKVKIGGEDAHVLFTITDKGKLERVDVLKGFNAKRNPEGTTQGTSERRAASTFEVSEGSIADFDRVWQERFKPGLIEHDKNKGRSVRYTREGESPAPETPRPVAADASPAAPKPEAPTATPKAKGRRGENLRGYTYEDYAANPDGGGTGDEMGAALLRYAKQNGGLLRLPRKGQKDSVLGDWIDSFLDGNARKNNRGDFIALFGRTPRRGDNDSFWVDMPADLREYVENMAERKGPEAVADWFLETRKRYADWAAKKRNAAREARAEDKTRAEADAAVTDEELAARAKDRDAYEAARDSDKEESERDADRLNDPYFASQSLAKGKGGKSKGKGKSAPLRQKPLDAANPPKWVSDAPKATTEKDTSGNPIVVGKNAAMKSDQSARVRATKSLRGTKVDGKDGSPDIFFDARGTKEYALSRYSRFLDTVKNKGATADERDWAARILKGKIGAIPYLREIVANATNERHTPYDDLKNTPGHTKTSAKDAKLWGGGKYEYDVKWRLADQNGAKHDFTGRLIVREDSQGHRFFYDIVDISDGTTRITETKENRRHAQRRNIGDDETSLPNAAAGRKGGVQENRRIFPAGLGGTGTDIAGRRPTGPVSRVDLAKARAPDVPNAQAAPDAQNAARNPNALSDPAFVKWAHSKGRAPSPFARRAYDAAQVKAAVPLLRNLFPGLKVTYHDRVEDPAKWEKSHPDGTQKLIVDPKSGETLGWYTPDFKEVHLNPGATPETLAHEMLHAAQDWAKQNSPELARTLDAIAKDCPRELKRRILRAYGAVSPEAIMKEWGAFNFMGGDEGGRGRGGEALREELARRESQAWAGRFWTAARDVWKDMAAKTGGNRIDLSALDGKTPQEAMDFLARAFAQGGTLGKVKGGDSRSGGLQPAKIDMTRDLSKGEKWQVSLHNYRDPLRVLRDEMAARGVKFTDGTDFYEAARLQKGHDQAAVNEANRRMEEYVKMLKKGGVQHEEVVEFMQAQAAVGGETGNGRNKMIFEEFGKQDGSGISEEAARKAFAAFAADGKMDALRKISDFLLEMQTEGLQYRVDSGLLDAETAQKWLDREPYHVPFRSSVDAATGDYSTWDNDHSSFAKNEFAKAKGRETLADDVVSWMFAEYIDAHTRGNENRVRRMIADAMRLNPELGVGTIKKGADKTGAFDFSAGNYKATRDGDAATGRRAKRAIVDDPNYRESRRNGDGGRRNVLAFKEGGRSHFIEFAEGERGERLQAAVNGRDLKRMPEKWNKVMRFWSSTATEWSPTFAVRNFVADNIDLAGNYVGDYGVIRGAAAYARHQKNVAALTPALAEYIATGRIPKGAGGEWIRRYEAAGGSIAGYEREGYGDIAAKIDVRRKAGMRPGVAIAKGVAMAVPNVIKGVNRYSELATRIAAFRTQCELGMTDHKAALWSRESTVDFNMKGNLTGVTNALFMFSNSTLGATARQCKALFSSKHGAQLAGLLAAYGFAEGLGECLANGDDDEREKRGEASGKDVSEYTRANSLYFRAGGRVYRAPFHAGPFSFIKYVGNCAARAVMGRMAAGDMAKALGAELTGQLTHYVGLGDTNWSASRGGGVEDDLLAGAISAMPTLAQAVAQPLADMDYAGRAIYRRTFDETKPDSANGRKSTPGIDKAAAAWINEFTGGNENRKGALDLAPETVKYVREAVLKNLGRDVGAAIQTGAMVMGYADRDVRNIPVARDFVRPQEGNDARYWNARSRYDADKADWKKTARTAEERAAYLRAHPQVRAGTDGRTEIDRATAKIDRYRKMEEGYRYVNGKAYAHEWTKDELAELARKRRVLQARVLELMGD